MLTLSGPLSLKREVVIQIIMYVEGKKREKKGFIFGDVLRAAAMCVRVTRMISQHVVSMSSFELRVRR